MATTKPKRPTYISPKGKFGFPSLTKPDYGNADYPNPDGSFKTNLIVPMSPEVQAFIDKLMPAYADAIALGAIAYAKLPIATRKKFPALVEQMFYTEEYEGEQGEEQPTGNVIFKFKTKYKITDKKTEEVRFNKIGLFDAKGLPLKAGTLIYGGTEGKLSFQTSDYFVAGQAMAGISLRLMGAQVINLVGPGARSAASLGFGQEEGYDSSQDAEADAAAEGDDSPFNGTPAAANGNPRDF